MNKFAIDYTSLQHNLDQPKCFKLADVKDKLVKVAFDIVKFKDADKSIDGLWQIRESPEGEYIVAMYEEPELEVKASSNKNWKVIASGDSVNIFYKSSPIGKISLASIGIPADEGYLVENYLPEKLAENKSLVNGVLSGLSGQDRAELLSLYPELRT